MMSLLYISISNSGGGVVAPPATRDAKISARYWRVDNLVYESNSTQIGGISFFTKTGSDGLTLIPVTSITTNLGDATSLNTGRYTGNTGAVVTTVDSITYFDFDYTTPVSPEGLSIYFIESDVDFIVSCDISYSHDGITWTQVGIFGRRIGLISDYIDVMGIPIVKPEQVTMTSAHVAVLSGRKPNGIVVPRADLVVLSGRHPSGAAITSSKTYVITTPV